MVKANTEARRRAADGGFTLIEVLVVAALIGVSVTLSLTAYAGYQKSSSHRGAVREVVATLRNAQVKAVTEAATYECRFTANDLQIHGPGGLHRSYDLDPGLAFVFTGQEHAVEHGFTHLDGSAGHSSCYFYAKGSATGGIVGVKRLDRSTEMDVRLEALTSRVSYCDNPSPVCTP